MRLPEDTIAAIVEEVAASHLGVGDRLARVRVRRGHGWQGDPLLWIDLLFTDERLALDTRRTLSLIGVVHDRLVIEGEDAFPVLSYFSRPDSDELTHAAE